MNYYPGMQGDWVGVAFRCGEANTHDGMIMLTTMGNKVHTEFLVGRGQMAVPYSAFDGPGFVRSPCPHPRGEWTVIALPVSDAKAAHAMVLQTVASNLQYNSRDLWQCCIKAMLPFEADLDCERPETWTSGVFCSQACLLLLRRMARAGLIQPNTNLRHALDSVHSRGCSPNTLYGLMQCGGLTLY